MSYRKLHIGKDVWEYVIGKEGAKIRSPEGKVTWIPKYTLVGQSKEEYRAEYQELIDDDYDGPPKIAIGPSHVKKHIEDNLI